jgi:hypothetical protein
MIKPSSFARLASCLSAALRRRPLGVIALALASVSAFAQGPDADSVAVRPAARAGGSLGAAAGTHAYEIPLFKDGFSFNQPANQWSYFFELRPNVVLAGSQFCQLNFFCSPLLKTSDGNITVTLNGTPVGSHKLGPGTANQLVQWHVELPLKYFKPSDFNELRIVSRQRTVDGPCKDTDNSGNWIRFAPGCRLHLVRTDPMRYPLNSYPFPYLDNLSVNANSVVQSHWEVPGGAQPGQVGEALGLASDWGADPKYLTYGLDIHLSQGSGRGGNTISIGGQAGGGGGAGTLDVASGGGPGNATLTIGGGGLDSIHMARKALADPSGVELMHGYNATIDHVREAPARTPTTQLGVFTFAQLGIPQVHLAGAFHQHATIYIQRPLRTDLGRESTVTIRFRHSASLNPLRSILSAYVNGIPIGSARLDADNANAGEFVARIPLSELSKNLWVVDLEAYHDLAAIDCSRVYDDVAWTVVEGSSFFELRTGQVTGYPYLDAFPYLVGRDGLAPAKVPISLSQNPTDAELSAGAVIAARAGQVNRQSFDWDVSYGSVPSSKTSGIIIATYDESSRLGGIANELLIAPTGGGHFKIDKRLDVQDSELAGGAFLQAIANPGSDTGVTYVLLGASQYAIQRFADALADPSKSVKITGQVTAITADGKTIRPYSVASPTVVNESVLVESNRYTPTMMLVMAIIVIGLILLLVWAANQFRRRPARRRA